MAGALVAAGHARQRLLDHAGIGRAQFQRDEVVPEQEIEGLAPEGLGIEFRAQRIRLDRTDGMDAADEAPHPFQRIRVVQFRRPSAAAREDGEAEALEFVQGAPIDGHGRHHWNFMFDQFGHEGMVFQDGVVAPAVRTVELDHHRLLLVAANLVDPVFIAVQGQQAAVAEEADAVDGVQHAARVEPGKRVRRAFPC